jgi:tetratricopeptide (TPR) repeat protein
VLHELPDHVPALLVRAHALRERGDEVLAAREIASALLRRPAETALHEMHVELLESLGDAAGARDARLALVDLYRERGETERVRELLQRCGGELEGALGASPPGPAPTDRFACFAPAEAVEDPDTRCDLAVGYLQVEAYRRALDELHPLLGAAEHRARVLPLVAAGYAGLGAFGAAAAALEEAIALESEGPEAAPLRYDLGSALSNAGERARALRVFQDTALLHPGFRDVEARIDALERELESEGAAC